MSSQELTEALEEVLAAMSSDADLMDDMDDDIETASRAIKW